MFALRRCAVRALYVQPARQLSTFRPISSTLRMQQPALYRSFHQSRQWLAEEGNKEASPTEQPGGETATVEPSLEEQNSEIKEESVATPEVADAAQGTPASPESAARGAAQEVESATETAKDTLSSAAETVLDATSSAASTAQDAFGFSRSSTSDSQNDKVLYVANLFFEVTVQQLEAKFTRFGQITQARIVTDARGMSKGFGYIEFASKESADRAVQELDQEVLQGRRMAVRHHVARPPREPRIRTNSFLDTSPSKTLFIGNLSYQMADRDLNDLFKNIPNVLDVRVAIDRRSGQPRGFAHADFVDISSAESAKQHLENKTVHGRRLRVDFSSQFARDSS